MLLIFFTGLPVMLLCLVLQAAFLTLCLRLYQTVSAARPQPHSTGWNIVVVSPVMLLMLLGNFLQMGIWAGLFRLLGEFDTFSTALYFSGVTFTTIGYGDLVMTPAWRLLAPLEAANGVLMFGVSTATMTAAVMDMIRQGRP